MYGIKSQCFVVSARLRSAIPSYCLGCARVKRKRERRVRLESRECGGQYTLKAYQCAIAPPILSSICARIDDII